MKKKDLFALRIFLSENLLKQKITKQRKEEIESYIRIIDRSLQEKEPFQYLMTFLSVVKFGELLQTIVEFFKSD